MWPVFPPSLVIIVIAAMLVLVLFAMRIVQPEWWSSRPARALVLFAFGGLLFGLALWGAGRSLESLWMVHAGAGIAQCGVLVLLPAAIVVPGAALLDRWLVRPVPAPAAAGVDVQAFASRGAPPQDRPADERSRSDDAPQAPAEAAAPHVLTGTGQGTSENAPASRRKLSATRVKVSRRALIRFGSASLPAMAAMGGASGFLQAKRDPTMPVVRVSWPGLHPDLHGLRILHLSDLHLGACLGLEDLKRGLEIARAAHRPDLIVLTGDLADDATLIPEALRLVAAANARYGALASLGNHEYLHDITVTRPHYEQSPVPLLCASGRAIRIGRATLYAGGADDPVHMGGDIPWFLTPSIEAAAAAAPAHADFRLLLCHRPEGHGPAAESGFDLTLSGHTHGGQVGMLGKSLLERIKPGIGWWGSYAKARPPEIARARELGTTRGPGGPSRLYTTSGFGHWFPFRMGCPTEMPIVILERREAPSRLAPRNRA